MNVNQITDKIKEIAISLETVNSVFEGDVYENWNSTEIKYGSFNVGLQNVSNDGNLCTYTFVFYYSDRLTQDKSNANSIYSDGVNTIQSVINVLNYMQFDISEQINYTPFEQKFMDYLAGVYATVNIVTSSSLGFCNMDDYNIEEVIEIVKNGVYDVTNYTKAVVNVPQMGEEKDPIFTASVAYNITQSDVNRWNRAGSIDLSSYVTKSELAAQSYITNADLPDYSNTYQAIGDYVTQTDLSSAGYLTSETDPVFSASVAYNITQSDVNRWNNGVTPDLSSYVTKSELSAQSYITNVDLRPYILTPLDPTGKRYSYFTLGKTGLGIHFDNNKPDTGIVSPTMLSWGTVMSDENVRYWVGAGTLRTFVFDTLKFSSYVTSSELAAQSYITANDLPDYSNTYQSKGDYVTPTELSAQGYITSETDPIFSASAASSITQSDINRWNNGVTPDLSSYVTKSELAAQSYITNADLPDYSNTYQAKGDYVTQTDLDNAGYLTSETDPVFSASVAAGITQSDINNWNRGGSIDLSSYVTKSELAAQSYITNADLPDYSNTYQAKGDYVTPGELSAQGYITSVTFPDYSNTYQAKGDYITPTDLNNAAYITANDLPDYSNTYQAKGDYVTSSELAAQSYITNADLPDYSTTYQAKGDYITPTDLNNASYVSATELSNASYVTQDTLSAQSYVTSSHIETKELVTAKALSYLYTYKVATSAFVFDAYTATLHITL